MKKVINYFQIWIVSMIFVAIATVVSSEIKDIVPENYTSYILKICMYMSVVMGLVISLIEIPFLRPDLKKKWTIGYFITVALGLLLVILEIFGWNYEGYVPDWYVWVLLNLYIVMFAVSTILAIIHVRYSIILNVILLFFWIIANPDANFFTALGALMLATIIGFLVRKIFFTKWSELLKEKEIAA